MTSVRHSPALGGRLPSPEQLRRLHAPLVAVAAALVSVGILTTGIVVESHAWWLFALWIIATVVALGAGGTVLVQVGRACDTMAARRMASFGVVIALLTATLGLAVYARTWDDVCPKHGPCAPADPGPGQRPQNP